MAGFEGLALSMYDKNALSFTNDGAHNFFSITVSDTTTVTSGYIQPFYASMTINGSFTGGNATQPNAFAADIFLGGTVTCEVSGVYVYMAKTGTATVTDSIIDGFCVYMDAIGSAAAYRSGFHAFSAETSTYLATGVDAAFLAESAGSTGTWGAIIGGMGVTSPKYFFHWKDAVTAESTGFLLGALGSTTAAGGLRIKIGGTAYAIPIIASTSGS